MEINRISSAASYSVDQTRSKELSDVRRTLETPLNTGVNPESVWRKVAPKYDVRNMSPEETAAMTYELYEGGAISMMDHLYLSLDRSGIPGGGYNTRADSAGRRDLIAEYEIEVGYARKRGDHKSLEHYERLLGHLNRLDAAGRIPPVNITA